MDAIEAESAVHVARFARLEQPQLASGTRLAAADTVLGLARRADGRLAHFDFPRRDQRLHEVELSDWADIFAERRAVKKTVDRKGGRKVGQHDPGRGPGTVPKGEGLVRPQKN